MRSFGVARIWRLQLFQPGSHSAKGLMMGRQFELMQRFCAFFWATFPLCCTVHVNIGRVHAPVDCWFTVLGGGDCA